MRILVLGSGGREHALVWKLGRSPQVERVLAAPGNPGIGETALCLPVPLSDREGVRAAALRHAVDLVVVGPEQPLAEGLSDFLRAAGLKVFGPDRLAARLEWSKAFAKEFMARHRIPTSGYRTFEAGGLEEALRYLRRAALPVVLKADGLASGKGVSVCMDTGEAERALRAMMEQRVFGEAGDRVLVEEYLEGTEASLLAVCDGERAVCLASAQDHKRAADGDRGPNTGGMGAFAPSPGLTGPMMETVRRDILEPTLGGMAREGHPFVGCLYIGLMLTTRGPRVVEYNCRFGDPETQVVLPLLETDLAELLMAASSGCLDRLRLPPALPVSGSAVCVVLCSAGYPGQVAAEEPIQGLDLLAHTPGVVVFHGGTRASRDGVLAAGGRVLGITAYDLHGGIPEVRKAAYDAVGRVHFRGMHFRKDIAGRPLPPEPGAA
ncbi:MAG: phosphoribosylamine--glycine ligase [Bacteroidota bacterium]